MSLESLLTTALQVQCPRVFPDVAPYGTQTPFVTYQQIGGDSPTFMDRAVPSKRNSMVQINVFSSTRSEAMTLMLAIEAALIVSTAFQAAPEGAMHADIDEDTDLRTSIQDFSIWSDR